MAAALAGTGAKRDPITLIKNDDGSYRVHDGNSTYAIANEAGWQHIPAIIARDQQHAEQIEATAKAAKAADKAQAAAGLARPGDAPSPYDDDVDQPDAKPIEHVVTGDVNEAIKALADGKTVELTHVKQVSTLLDRLQKVVQDMEAKGEKAPTFDLCKVSVKGTNLFCAQSKEIPRLLMPQLTGAAIPGSPADSMEKNKWGNVDMTEDFVKMLQDRGVKVESTVEKAANLKASQAELDGKKVAAVMQQVRGGEHAGREILISGDDYIVDGHHMWAATVAHDYEDG
jgi:hypothetical protein